jgi:CRISPR/Cas system-associated exonuclease Cas4 (RecB family)
MKKIPNIVKQIKKQYLKEIEKTDQKSISYSQLSMFESCPHKWSLQYKDGYYQQSFSINMTFGTALHETIQHFLTVTYDESGVIADAIDLDKHFEDTFRGQYLKEYIENNKIHFSNQDEMDEFYNDGIEILKFIKHKKGVYFNKKGWYLVGCEVPVLLPPNEKYNVIFKGYLDVVLYHEPTNTFEIIDIKTSSRGWNDKAKKDQIKQAQLILYKYFFSKQFGIPIENIDIKFFILKRKIWEKSDYAPKRIQEFIPTNGKLKVKQAVDMVDNFLDNTFNIDGTYKDMKHEPNPSKWNCTYCNFKDDKELCSKSYFK